MNKKKKINVKVVNMDILKQRMNPVFIAVQKNTEGLDAMNVDMKKMNMMRKQIISYVMIVFLLKNIITKILIMIITLQIINTVITINLC